MEFEEYFWSPFPPSIPRVGKDIFVVLFIVLLLIFDGASGRVDVSVGSVGFCCCTVARRETDVLRASFTEIYTYSSDGFSRVVCLCDRLKV